MTPNVTRDDQHAHHPLSATVLRRMSLSAVGGTLVGIGIALVADLLFRHPILFFFSGHGFSSVDPVVTQVVLMMGGVCGCLTGTLSEFLRILVEALQMHSASVSRLLSAANRFDEPANKDGDIAHGHRRVS